MENDPQKTAFSWLQQASIEIMPRPGLDVSTLQPYMSPSQLVYITFMANSQIEQITQTAQHIQQAGSIPVAHIPARHLPDKDYLKDYVQALKETGVKHVLLLAGGRSEPVGQLSNSMELLATGLFDNGAFDSVGFAAHPNGHPAVAESTLKQSMQEKVTWAQQEPCSAYFITQFVFESKLIKRWLASLDPTHMLPIEIGLPGLTRTKTLMRFASIAGITNKQLMSMVLRHPWQWLRFLTQWSPKPIVEDIAAYYANHPEIPLRGLHFFTFGGFQRTAQWLQSYYNKESLS